jgi:capsid protein
MLHAVLNDIHNLDDLQIMENKAARDGAEITNVIKNKSGTADVGDMIASGGAVPAGSLTQDQKRTYYENTTGGRTFFMQQDDDIQQLKVERPSGATRDYWIFLEHKICAGVGIPRQLVYSESLQGTVQRSVLDIAAAWFRIRSGMLVRGFAQIYYYVLEDGIAKDVNLADPPGNWRRFTWRPPRAPNVDVGRNASAMLAELAAGTTNYKRIFAELGLDYVEELTQKADEAVLLDTLAKERGISVDRIAAQGLPPASAEPVTDPEDEMQPPPVFP